MLLSMRIRRLRGHHHRHDDRQSDSDGGGSNTPEGMSGQILNEHHLGQEFQKMEGHECYIRAISGDTFIGKRKNTSINIQENKYLRIGLVGKYILSLFYFQEAFQTFSVNQRCTL